MKFSTLFYDLTDNEVVQKINSQSIDDLFKEETKYLDKTGETSPFYIVFKLSGLFDKKKPESFSIINKFQETPYPLKFIAVFNDPAPSSTRAKKKIYLSQELQKENLRILWVSSSNGLAIDGQAIPQSLGVWDQDPEGKLALQEFIDILKIPEVFESTLEDINPETVYIPGFNKLEVGFGNAEDTVDVFYKAINTITDKFDAKNLPGIIHNPPTETILGSDLKGEDFIESSGQLYENIEEILEIQRKLLYLFGLTSTSKISRYQTIKNRVSISPRDYSEQLKTYCDTLQNSISSLGQKLSTVDAMEGLDSDDLRKLEEIGVDINSKISEFETQEDDIVTNEWRDIVTNLRNGHSFEALIPKLEDEIDGLTPKNKDQISKKINKTKEAKIFQNLDNTTQYMPRFLSTLLGGFWTKLLNKLNYILFVIGLALLIFSNYQIEEIKAICIDDGNTTISDISHPEFFQEYVIGDNPKVNECRDKLPKLNIPGYASAEEYEEKMNDWKVSKEEWIKQKNLYSQGEISAAEYNTSVEARNNKLEDWQLYREEYNQKTNLINNIFFTILFFTGTPLILYVIAMFISLLLFFLTNFLVRSWGNNLELRQLQGVANKLKSTVAEIVINDIKFGKLRSDLTKKLTIYKDLLVEIQEHTNSFQDEYFNVDGKSDEEIKTGSVNPRYVERVTPLAQGKSQEMYDKVRNISRDEIIDIFQNATNNNIQSLFGRNPETFKEKSKNEFIQNLDLYKELIIHKGILDLENSSNQNIIRKKEDFRAELWKNDSIIKEPLERIIEATKNKSIMQMIDSENIELLEKQNTDWKFIKFLPESTINWFKALQDDEKRQITETEQSETAGFIRFIPISRNNLDVVTS